MGFFEDAFSDLFPDEVKKPLDVSVMMREARSNLRVNYHGFYESADYKDAEPMPVLTLDVNNPLGDAPTVVDDGMEIDLTDDDVLPDHTRKNIGSDDPNDAFIYSFYVPGNWSMEVYDKDRALVGTFHGPKLAVIGANVRTLPGGSRAPMSHHTARSLKFHRQRVGDPTRTATWEENQLRLALGQATLHVAGHPLRAWLPQSHFADLFMQHYCLEKHRDNHDECACFRDQEALLHTYSEKAGFSPPIRLPVTCYGRNCGTKGYRTHEMAKQTCSYELCVADLTAEGKRISNTGTSELYCAGKIFKSDPEAAAAAASNANAPTRVVHLPAHQAGGAAADTADVKTPYSTWVMLGVGGLVFCMLLFFLFDHYKVFSGGGAA